MNPNRSCITIAGAVVVGLLLALCFSAGLSAQNAVSADSDTIDIEQTGPETLKRGIWPYSHRWIVSRPWFEPVPRLQFVRLSEEVIRVERLPSGNFLAEHLLHNIPIRLPGIYTFEEYQEISKRHHKIENWQMLIAEFRETEEVDRGLLDFRFTVPGGRESAFTTIFGRPEVNLRVSGVANMNVGASIQQTADPALPPDQQTRVDPTFDQNLQLNIQGTVGDKLTISTDWDTERAFDYQNRLHIAYEGYEDEIIQSVELGNVSMQTGNTLIRGSGSLFGIKSVADLGALRLTSVLSQQKGESRAETITGGSQERQINIRPADYENDRHFFIDFYTRQEFERSMANPQQRLQTLQISEVNLWLMRDQVQAEEGARQAVALTEYGVVQNPDGSYAPPDNRFDRFDQQEIEGLRDPSIGVSASDFGLEDPRDFEEGYFTRLEEGVDYRIDPASGFVSLERTLGSRDVLAISFTYVNELGETVSVGDVNQGGSGRIFLKKLRASNQSTDHKAFPLTMRNIYSLGATNLTRDHLDIELQYTEGNVAQNRLPGRSTTIMQDLGLDRVDAQGALEPDNQIDFGTGTLNASTGRIIFPYLEPFGSRLEEVLTEAGAGDAELDRLVYRELYRERQRNAERSSKNQFYRFDGVVKGGAQENFTLDIALVEGSVRVFANGTELQEGIDYQVDYSFGSITILNDRYIAPGQEIRIEYENQDLMAIEQKTFTGLRAEYTVNNDLHIGGTYFRYNERPLDDKIRIGDEPISNMVIGFDANARFDAPFLTSALNALPLLSTREPSEFEFSGEFAQLRPGVAQTRAVRRAIRNDELHSDEERGLSYIDDFEGSAITINMRNPTRWHLAAAPAVVPGYDADAIYFNEPLAPPATSPLEVQADRNDLRSKFSWYTIPRNIRSILEGVEFTPESRQVRVNDVFPGRETYNPQEEIISTLDLFYDPTRRGPYNYNMDLPRLLEEEPDRTWGGMTAVIPSGQEDFTQNNVEFLEFWVQPLLPDGREPGAADLADYDGKIYIDIGTVSEDVVPNARLNTEDGLAHNPDLLIPDRPDNPRSYISSNPPPPEGEFSTADRELEDVGLDGLPSTGGFNGLNEQTVFADFISRMRELYGADSAEYRAIADDPSNDNYLFYGESAMEGMPLHERFHRMLGYYEGNTPLDQSDRRAVTNRPNTEGLVNPARVELNNAYFQYEIEFNPADVSRINAGGGKTFIEDRVPGSRPVDRWYQVRIPLEEFKRKVGQIEDFQDISYVRIWMSGYKKPFTLRFATLEFVGSQWQHSEQINEESDPSASLRVSTVNIEENANRRPVPYRQPLGSIRAQDRGTQLQSLQNEQSIVLDVQNLGPGNLQMVRRNFPGGLNLLHYSNMRMFVHGEGFEERGEAELVMRFGNDLENNYYEYRQPVTPTDINYPFQEYDQGAGARLEEEAEQVWLYDENSMNIVLRAFNQLKQLRNQEAPDDPTQVYERFDLLEDSVPGAVIAIKGNPSLDRITQVGMGVRNPYDATNPESRGRPSLNAQFWLNELRVSGFDNESGWAANAKSTLKLADFATINSNISRQTDSFGALDSRLGQRRLSDELAYDVNSTFNLDRLIPDRYGWTIPLTLTTRSSTVTPRYLPNEGDIRLSDFEQAIRARAGLTESQQDQLIDERVREIQTFRRSYSVNLTNLNKRDSRSRISRYTLDNTTLNYVYNTSRARNPQYQMQDGWNFTTSARYSINFRNVRHARPFAFGEGITFLDRLSRFEIALMPSNVTTSIRMNRTYEERRRRIFDEDAPMDPLQQTHNFTYNTTLGFGYNPIRSITTGFQAQGGFDLSRIGVRDAGLTGIDSTATEPVPTFRVLEQLLTDSEISPRRSSYQEDYSGSWRPNFGRFRPISWMNYSLQYSGGYRWENSPFESNLGARVSNNFRLDHNLRLEVRSLLDRWSFYTGLRDADREDARRRDARNDLPGENGDQPEGDLYGVGDHLRYAGRRVLLGLMSFQNFQLTWNDAKTGSQAGYAGSSQLFDMVGLTDTFSPSFLYRIGYQNRISRERLIENVSDATIQLPATNTFRDDFRLQTSMLPFSNFSIDINWETGWDERESESILLDPDGEISSVRSASGNISSSVWAFGGGYRDLFEKQLQTAFDDIVASSDTISDHRGNMDGRTILNRVTLQEDFRRAYLGPGRSATGERGFTPFPMPNWRINWTGIEELIPYLGRYMERASITHAYSGSYRMSWTFNSNAGPLPPRRVGSYVIVDERPEYEPSTINVERTFSPLLQFNVTWSQSLRTQFGYEYSKLTSFALSNINVTERVSKGLTFSMTYSMRNFRLPFFRQLTNVLDVTVSGRVIEDTEQRFMLDSDIERALTAGPDEIVKDPSLYSISPRQPSGQRRISASTNVGYRFSDTVQANFEYAFGRVLPKSSRTFDRTTHDIRFNIRINFQAG